MTTSPGWLSLRLLVVGLAVVSVSCLLLASMVVGTKGVRARQEHRRARHLGPYRRELLELAAGEGGEAAVHRLDRIGADSWPTVQAYVITLLAKVKGEPARDLVRVLERHDAQGQARRDTHARRSGHRGRAALVLGRCAEPTDLGALVDLLDDRDVLVRQAAAIALGQLGAPEAAPALLTAAREVRGAPALPAGVVVDSLMALDFGIEDALSTALRSPDAGVRAIAAEVVAGRATVLARSAVRQALEHEPDPTVAASLCRAVGAIGDDEDVPTLQRMATEGAPVCRRSAVHALGTIDSAASVRVLATLALVAEPETSSDAARALATMHHPEARETLERVARDGSLTARDELAMLRLRRAPRAVAAQPRPLEVQDA